MNFLTSSRIRELNKIISQMYSIDHSVINPDILDSISELPRRNVFGYEPYATMYEKAAATLEGVIRYHPFEDGNKRTGLLSAFEFLGINNYTFVIPIGAPRFIVNVANDHGLSEQENARLIKKISRWIEKHSSEPGNSEKLKSLLARYRRTFRALYIFSKVPPLSFIIGFLMIYLLQLKIYQNSEIQTQGMSAFLAHTLKRIIEFNSQESNGAKT